MRKQATSRHPGRPQSGTVSGSNLVGGGEDLQRAGDIEQLDRRIREDLYDARCGELDRIYMGGKWYRALPEEREPAQTRAAGKPGRNAGPPPPAE